jgi:hypothetical protein
MGQLFLKQKKMAVNQRKRSFENSSNNFENEKLLFCQQFGNILIIDICRNREELFASFRSFEANWSRVHLIGMIEKKKMKSHILRTSWKKVFGFEMELHELKMKTKYLI